MVNANSEGGDRIPAGRVKKRDSLYYRPQVVQPGPGAGRPAMGRKEGVLWRVCWQRWRALLSLVCCSRWTLAEPSTRVASPNTGIWVGSSSRSGAFRTIGIGVGLLLVLVLWLKYRRRHGIRPRDPLELGTQQRTGMPAAVVSVLEGREVSDRTLLAAIIEMCQRGALQFQCVGTRSGFLYQPSQQGPVQFEWEQLICDSLPSRPTSVQALRDLMDGHKDAIGDQLGEYLQRQGLFHDNPIRIRRERLADGFGWATLAAALMGVGSGLWMALWLTQWWANSLSSARSSVSYTGSLRSRCTRV